MKMIPMMDGGDDVGMVLSPQCFHNLNAEADIFNHSNIHFWECALLSASHSAADMADYLHWLCIGGLSHLDAAAV
jgi:hypothetical protein